MKDIKCTARGPSQSWDSFLTQTRKKLWLVATLGAFLFRFHGNSNEVDIYGEQIDGGGYPAEEEHNDSTSLGSKDKSVPGTS